MLSVLEKNNKESVTEEYCLQLLFLFISVIWNCDTINRTQQGYLNDLSAV